MEISFLIEEMERNGVIFSVDSGKIRLHASEPQSLRSDFVAVLREHKAAAMDYLNSRRSCLPVCQRIEAGNLENSLPIAGETAEALAEPLSRCGSSLCRGCYAVGVGVFIHPPKGNRNF